MEIEKFFFPQSVAIFGVSDSPGNLGKEIVGNLNRFGFEGRVYGLGRREMEVESVRVYTDLDRVPEIPDLAVLLVPASAISAALESCGAKGVRHVVIETGGFSEFGEERKSLEGEILEIAGKWNIACMGPNCIGVTNMENGLCMPFVPFQPNEVVKGKNSFIAQSGGLVHEMVRRCDVENVGLNKLTSIGNKLMLDESDVLQFLAGDAGTETIGMYLEDIRDGRRLMSLASGTGKPVIVLKGNASPAGREIASFHTAALLGDEAVTEAAFRQAGIHQVADMQEIVDCFKIFDLPAMKGPNLAVISRSGGQTVLLADEAYRHGFPLAKLSPTLFGLIAERAKAGVIRSTNPIDLGDVFDEVFYLEVLGEVLKEEGVDGVVFFFDYPLENCSRAVEIIKGVERLCRLHQKPVVFCLIPDRESWFEIRYASTFPFFTEPRRAFAALRRSLDHYRRSAAGRQGSFSIKEASGAPSTSKAPPASGHPVSPSEARYASAHEAFSLMETYGVPVVEYELVHNVAQAIAATGRLGYPVVLKRIVPFILHKTDVGAVRLAIRSDEELGQAFKEMEGDLYLVQKMAPEGIETIIGGKRDDQFGPVIMFGLGGVLVEVLKDVTMRVAPIDETVAARMIDEIKGAPLFRGVRGTAPSDVPGLVKALVDVSRLLAEHQEIKSLDINPFRVLEQGQGCLSLDVKMELLDGRLPGASRHRRPGRDSDSRKTAS
jgi:acetyltransferase